MGVHWRQLINGEIWCFQGQDKHRETMDLTIWKEIERGRYVMKNNGPTPQKDKYLGKTIYVIGKGPTADFIINEQIKLPEDSVIICVNEVIFAIENLYEDVYSLHLDLHPREKIPTIGTKVCIEGTTCFYPTRKKLYLDRTWIRENIKTKCTITAIYSIALAQCFGASLIRLVGCDCLIGLNNYGSAVPNLFSNKKECSYAQHIKHYINQLRGSKWEVLMPKSSADVNAKSIAEFVDISDRWPIGT